MTLAVDLGRKANKPTTTIKLVKNKQLFSNEGVTKSNLILEKAIVF